MREAIDRTIGVIDETMSVIACSDLGRIGEVSDAVNAESFSAPGSVHAGRVHL